MINIGRYRFHGPFYEISVVRNTSGIYAILDCRTSGTYVLDIGESESLRDRLSSHDRSPCWSQHRQGTLGIATLYLPDTDGARRRTIERELRTTFDPVCGRR